MASLSFALAVALTACEASLVKDPSFEQDFRAAGWAISRQLLPTSELQAVSARLESLLSEHGRRAFGDDGSKEVRFTFAVHELDGAVSDFVSKDTGALWQQAARLAGTERLCILMDRGFSKDPGDPETHWHRDDEAIGLPNLHPGLRTVHAWIPLVAMGKDFGTLRYLLGTHRRQTEQDDNLQFGDVAWHDGWTLHSAGSNQVAAVRNGFAISYAYCIDPNGCRGFNQRVSHKDATCRAADLLFDKQWRERHRNGENDYSKNMITEPFAQQATRFVLRSVVGALCGLGVHALIQRCRGKEHKVA